MYESTGRTETSTLRSDSSGESTGFISIVSPICIHFLTEKTASLFSLSSDDLLESNFGSPPLLVLESRVTGWHFFERGVMNDSRETANAIDFGRFEIFSPVLNVIQGHGKMRICSSFPVFTVIMVTNLSISDMNGDDVGGVKTLPRGRVLKDGSCGSLSLNDSPIRTCAGTGRLGYLRWI